MVPQIHIQQQSITNFRLSGELFITTYAIMGIFMARSTIQCIRATEAKSLH